MTGRIVRALVWGWIGASIGFLVVVIIAIRINTIRYASDPSMDIDGAASALAYVTGWPMGFILGAYYSLRKDDRQKFNAIA